MVIETKTDQNSCSVLYHCDPWDNDLSDSVELYYYMNGHGDRQNKQLSQGIINSSPYRLIGYPTVARVSHPQYRMHQDKQKMFICKRNSSARTKLWKYKTVRCRLLSNFEVLGHKRLKKKLVVKKCLMFNPCHSRVVCPLIIIRNVQALGEGHVICLHYLLIM